MDKMGESYFRSRVPCLGRAAGFRGGVVLCARFSFWECAVRSGDEWEGQLLSERLLEWVSSSM